MHPLLGNLSSLSDNDLEQKILEVNRRYWQTRNPEVQMQISMVLESYKLEQETRRIHKKLSEQENGNSDLDSLIKVS